MEKNYKLLTISDPAELQLKVFVLHLVMDYVDTTTRGKEKRDGKSCRWANLTFLPLLSQSLYKSAPSSEEREIGMYLIKTIFISHLDKNKIIILP